VKGWAVLLVAVVLAGGGCRRPPADAEVTEHAYHLYEKVRAGTFQLSAASQSAVEAIDALNKALEAAPRSGEIHDALMDVSDYLESAGDLIARHIDEPPPFATFKRNLEAQQARLSQAIQDAGDAYQDLAEADGLLQTIQSSDAVFQKRLQDLERAIAAAQDDVASALEAMGGPPPDIASG